MMSPVKLPYYPKVQGMMRTTRFGAIEVENSKVYNQPLADKVILRVDCLECLRERFGDDCFICRDLLYTILAGEHHLYDAQAVFASYYRKYKPITEYVNEVYYYGDSSVPILERAVLPLRDTVDTYKQEVMSQLSNAGGKFLVQSHDFVYYAFAKSASIPDMKGVKVIC